jgi:hypothetical protein
MLTTKDGKGYAWWEYRDANPELQIDHGFDPSFDYGDPVRMFIHHMIGFRPGIEDIKIYPRLLPEWKDVTAKLRCGSQWITLRIHNDGRYIHKAELQGEQWMNISAEDITIPIPEEDFNVEIWLQDKH